MTLASDGDRERASASLREHFVRGRLTLEELSERTDLVLRACADLPQFPAQRVAGALVRGAALVVFTGAWLLFSLLLLFVFALTLLIHGATALVLAGFLLVWLVPTYLLSRLWRKGPQRHLSS